ncbi:rhamnulokinase [Pullulanibacillus camelliae]|uniref:Rhamnulokinase n=1 Tax=Pullulanibacillus camelliae TaxID=1707096 RepID=A0A8J2VQ94_9BACL|nr:rhamnulokinase [Pullulanibacillus camelliae]GGE36793.1 rhamnulokinase [Pullulanibacillus camelliae]
MTTYSLAIDIGASSGRCILGHIEAGRLVLQEVYRFENRLVKKDSHVCWEVERLFAEICKGIQKCKAIGIQPASIGIDTWAVDFVLLDEADERLTDAVAYRDARTDGMMEEVFQIIMKERLYLETGIQFQKFNTLYQLYALKKQHPKVLEKAKTFLMIPDYFNFLLTGRKANEYTNATSTQLVNAFTKRWDHGLLKALGLNEEMFQEIHRPKTVLGPVKKELTDCFGWEMQVILPATHDTGSAVLSMPEQADSIYISSGTWSLIGVENHFPICVTKALDYNFTNEGGLDYRFRFLKNIMGLWMIQEVKRLYDHAYSFSELVELAKEATHFHSLIDVNADRFLNPDHMIDEVQAACREAGQPVPQTPGELAKCIYESLALSYKKAVQEIEDIFERPFQTINVIGGGCQNEYLNQLLANATQKRVNAGPVEATAIGNLSAQLMALGEITDLQEARMLIRQSFDVKTYLPAEHFVQ